VEAHQLAVERKQMEEALRESEAQLRELYDEAPVGYHELDGKGHIRRVNRTELAVLGYTAEEMVGRPVWEFVLEREAAHRAVLAKLAGGDLVPAFEWTYLRKDGTQVPVLIEDRLLRDAEGRITGIRSTNQDISARKQAEEATRESQRLLEAVLETTRALIVLADSGGRILLFNHACEELTGHSRQEVFGKSIADCFLDQAWVSIALKLLVDRGDPGLLVPHECPWQTASGERRLIEWRFRVFPSPHDGRPCVLGTGVDITARKRAEEALVQRTRQLDAIRMVTAEITRELDLPTLLELINRHAAELMGAASGTVYLWDEQAQLLIPAAWHGLGEWMKDQRRRLGEKISGAVAQRREGLIVNDYPRSPYANPAILEHVQINAVLGEPLIYRDRLLGTLTVDKHGPGSSFTKGEQGVLRLFTAQAAIAIENARLYERVRTGRERLQRLSRRLVELQESERRSIARELHDQIGQLLTGLKLLLEMSASVRPEKLTPPLSEAQALVNELIVRVREMSLNLRPSMLDDLGLLPALLWHFERYTTQTNVRVNFQHSGLDRRFSPEIETAAYRIVQEALSNVARHARTPEVTVRIHVGSEAVDVQVEDKGVGFDPGAVLAADASIGLAGMRERAQLLGGHLTVESAPGAGTTVKAELPLGDTGAVERRAEGRRQ